MNKTQIKLKPEYREKLERLADQDSRSMANMVEVLIDRAMNTNAAGRVIQANEVYRIRDRAYAIKAAATPPMELGEAYIHAIEGRLAELEMNATLTGPTNSK